MLEGVGDRARQREVGQPRQHLALEKAFVDLLALTPCLNLRCFFQPLDYRDSRDARVLQKVDHAINIDWLLGIGAFQLELVRLPI